MLPLNISLGGLHAIFSSVKSKCNKSLKKTKIWRMSPSAHFLVMEKIQIVILSMVCALSSLKYIISYCNTFYSFYFGDVIVEKLREYVFLYHKPPPSPIDKGCINRKIPKSSSTSHMHKLSSFLKVTVTIFRNRLFTKQRKRIRKVGKH